MNRRFHVLAAPSALIVSLFVLAACGGSGGGGSSSSSSSSSGASSTSSSSSSGGTAIVVPPDDACNIANFGTAMLAAVNAARATGRNCGATFYPAAPALTWNAQLAQAAAGHSHDMANNNYISHTSLDGRTLADRIVATGYAYTWLGENIAAGYGTIDATMAGWLGSAGHCANIMNANFRELGAACAINNDSTYRDYWTQNFGTPR